MAFNKKHAGLIAIILVAIALAVFLTPRSPHPSATSKKSEKKQPALIQSDYIAVNPSFGPLIITRKIPITFDGNTATGKLLSNKNLEGDQKVKVGQEVVLYDQKDLPQPLGGKISKIENKTEQLIITIDLPEGTNSALLARHVDIITLEMNGAKRLPKTAIMHDKNGQAFVWRAFPDFDYPDAYKLSRLNIEVGRGDQDLFLESGFEIKSDDFVIVNPDNKILTDTPYLLKTSKLNAYRHNPIRQSWITLELDRLRDQQERMIQEAEECGIANTQQNLSGLNNAKTDASSSNNCTSKTSLGDYEGTDPFLIFQNLIGEFQTRDNDTP